MTAIYEDEIALLVEDIRRWSNQDARIDEALTQILKLVRAEVDALALEARELQRESFLCERCHQPSLASLCRSCDPWAVGLYEEGRKDWYDGQ